jgi:hypothetical protein
MWLVAGVPPKVGYSERGPESPRCIYINIEAVDEDGAGLKNYLDGWLFLRVSEKELAGNI